MDSSPTVNVFGIKGISKVCVWFNLSLLCRKTAFLPPQGKEECHVFQAASLEDKRDFVKLLKIESCIVSNGKHH